MQIAKPAAYQEDPDSHSPTDYALWYNANKPYEVEWKQGNCRNFVGKYGFIGVDIQDMSHSFWEMSSSYRHLMKGSWVKDLIGRSIFCYYYC